MRGGDRVGRRRREVPRRSSSTRAATRASSTTTRRCRGAAIATMRRRAARRLSSPTLEAELVGRAAVALGAGRDRWTTSIDPGVGHHRPARRPGTRVRRAIRSSRSSTAAAAGSRRRCRCCEADRIADAPPIARPLVVDRMCADSRRIAWLPRSTLHAREPARHRTAVAVRLARPDRSLGAGAGGRRGLSRSWRSCRRAAAAAARRPDRHHGDRVRAVDQPPRHRPADGRLGPGAAGRLRAARAEDRGRPARVPDARRRDQPAARLRVRRVELRLRAARRQGSLAADHDARCSGAEGRAVRRHLRVPGAADDHLHRRAVRHPLLLRRHAARRPRCSRS